MISFPQQRKFFCPARGGLYEEKQIAHSCRHCGDDCGHGFGDALSERKHGNGAFYARRRRHISHGCVFRTSARRFCGRRRKFYRRCGGISRDDVVFAGDKSDRGRFGGVRSAFGAQGRGKARRSRGMGGIRFVCRGGGRVDDSRILSDQLAVVGLARGGFCQSSQRFRTGGGGGRRRRSGRSRRFECADFGEKRTRKK